LNVAPKDEPPAGGGVAPLWAKGGLTDAAMLAYTARDDWRLDQALLAHDLRASKAHVRGLGRVGALLEADAATLVGALEELERELAEGRFVLDDQVEDGHTAIELELVRRLGDVGKRVHLGRSRNDQVLVAMRLYERDRLATLARLATAGGAAFLGLARRTEHVVMPGYTHLQRAMPQSVAHWAASYAEGFAESARTLLDARRLAGGCPLGGRRRLRRADRARSRRRVEGARLRCPDDEPALVADLAWTHRGRRRHGSLARGGRAAQARVGSEPLLHQRVRLRAST
jgi:hypothetical protein